MENLTSNYTPYASALPPRPIRIAIGGWAGSNVKMEDGADAQPWHCLPFVEGAAYGLELVYPYENECHVVNDGGKVRFEWDFAKEPGGGVTGAEFVLFSPVLQAQYYLFNTRLDLQPPPEHVLRTGPHPRFFTDETGTVPLAMIGHLQNEWYPRMTFVVFRAPRPGQRHIFRKGEPFVQVLFVPGRATYATTRMSPEEEARRRELEQAIQVARFDIAEHQWLNSDGNANNNHYKVLARAFARDGMAGVNQVVEDAVRRHELALAKDKSIAEALAQGAQFIAQQKNQQAREIFTHVLSRDPNNAEALCHLGIAVACLGDMMRGLTLMTQSVALDPRVPRYHASLAELLRRLGRLEEAEASIRSALGISPDDPSLLNVLGVILAQQGRLAEGLEAYREACAGGCSLPRTHVEIGAILARHGRYAEARACYHAALAVDPGFLPARSALQELPA